MNRSKKIFFAFVLAAVMIFAVIPASARETREAERILLLAAASESLAPNASYTVLTSLSSVFLNRLADPAYPNTLGAVISAAGIEITGVGEVFPSSRALRAAADAMSGFDPTSGALVYACGFDPCRDPRLIRLETDGWCFY